ncbi:MAG: histidine ammonia-lyase [Fimbriimonadaceae bacterium]|nr:histidine ammonia-lyase [Fimbriimonadaceae bacterium]
MLVEGGLVPLSLFPAIARGDEPAEFSEQASERMAKGRSVVDQVLRSGRTVYGVNTGFGRLSDTGIGSGDLEQLQSNLIRSHACGVGEPLSQEETRLVLVLRANVFATGGTGIRPETARTLLSLYTSDVIPVVPSLGSVGASGDLAPLAHIALVLLGEGQVWSGEGRVPALGALQRAGIAPIRLAPKEGLSLVNGTQVMLAVGGLALAKALRVARAADVAAAISVDALLGTDAAFCEEVCEARPHRGQANVGARLRHFMAGSSIRESHRTGDSRVQDAYSLRCSPQVHGAVMDTLCFARFAVETESRSLTDNPLVFPESNRIVSGGNFHGAPLALAFDHARAALAVLASICERRTDRLVNPDLSEGLPPFLARKPGLESGLMMPHVLSAALVNELRTTAHPASVDNTSTSGGKEDHVSMGMTSALLLRRAVELAARVVAVEMFAAAEGLEHRKPLEPGPNLAPAVRTIRDYIPELTADRSTGPEIEALSEAILAGVFDGFGDPP